jgi:hypothetical protein
MVSEEIRSMIPDYVRGLLSPAEAKEVESALEGSPDIFPEFEAAQSYYAALNQIPEVKAPAGFAERVNSRIDKVPLWPRVRHVFFEPLFIKLPLEFAGLAACLVASLIVFNPFSLRERLTSRPTAAIAAVEQKTAVVPTVEATADSAAAAPAPEAPVETQATQLMPEPGIPAVAEASQPPAKADIPAAAAPAGFDLAKMPEQKSPAAAEEVRKEPSPLQQKALADALTEKKAETRQKETAPEPAAVAARKPAAGAQSLDNIPTLPAASALAAAPAPAAVSPKPTAKAVTAPVAEDIGSVDLTTDAMSSSSTPENTENILQTVSTRCRRTTKDGQTAFECILPPSRLNLLIESLSRSFNVTTHLLPYDPASVKPVKVSFILQ